MKLIGLYSGQKSTIGRNNSPTGIFKLRRESVVVNPLGIVGDLQADKRFHGGPERALHQFSLSGYEKIIKWHPLIHKNLISGSMGENVSTTVLDEKSVCIGDVYRFGEVMLQVSCPRMPCWKIDSKFNHALLSRFILKHKINGWYYRVLKTGKIRFQDSIELVDRANTQISIYQLLCTALEPDHAHQKNVVRKNIGDLSKQWAEQYLRK
jgi:MOSC domain-containing protein YiiM